MGDEQYIGFDEAVALIVQHANRLVNMGAIKADMNNIDAQIQVFAEKFVLDVVAYCHRTNFPRVLAYTAAELAMKYIADMNRMADGSLGPLKSLKENDVQFEWAVSSVAPIGCISEQDFESIRNKLNLYRKVVHHG